MIQLASAYADKKLIVRKMMVSKKFKQGIALFCKEAGLDREKSAAFGELVTQLVTEAMEKQAIFDNLSPEVKQQLMLALGMGGVGAAGGAALGGLSPNSTALRGGLLGGALGAGGGALTGKLLAALSGKAAPTTGGIKQLQPEPGAPPANSTAPGSIRDDLSDVALKPVIDKGIGGLEGLIQSLVDTAKGR